MAAENVRYMALLLVILALYLFTPSADRRVAELDAKINHITRQIDAIAKAVHTRHTPPLPSPNARAGATAKATSGGTPAPTPAPTPLVGFDTLGLTESCLRHAATPPDAVRPFRGGNFEDPGVFEEALRLRAPDKELIFLSVGDTRDHRRAQKDPKLSSISTDFLRNLLANLKRLSRRHYVILSTRSLCARLQREDCELACGWSTLWDDHAGLAPWGLKPGDMFLMWAQQWRYIARAMELGYRVLRADTDVYFAEDPWPMFHSPLFADFEMLVQHDFVGSARPACTHPHLAPAGGSALPTELRTCGTRDQDQALLNIGLVYLRSRPGGGVFASINGTWARFLSMLSQEPARPPHLNGKVDSQRLIDQPFMRAEVNALAVADGAAQPAKPRRRWSIVHPSGLSEYHSRCVDPGDAMGGAAAGLCVRAPRRASRLRGGTPFLAQVVRPRGGGGRAERIALAPDWLFGRGCLTHVAKPRQLAAWARRHGGKAQHECAARGGGVSPAPGPAAGLLVATHFVYSMSSKRTNAFRSFGWDLADVRNRSAVAPDCMATAERGILFGHTHFGQLAHARSVLCALPPAEGPPSCPCCVGLPSLKGAESRGELPRSGLYQSTIGASKSSPRLFESLESCEDYQLFWD